MPIIIDESKKDELKIIQRGSTSRALFFFIMGLIAQLLLIWGYWNFLEVTGPWTFFWLGMISSEFFPFFQTLFLFGGGCFLITIREVGWTELWIIKKELFPDSDGIQNIKMLFRWPRTKSIVKDQITTLRLHVVPLDRLKLYNRYQIEIDYRLTPNSSLESEILYKDDGETAKSNVFYLVRKIQEILKLETQKTEAEPPVQP